MKTYSETIGKRIRQLRKERRLSLEQLALIAGIAPSFLGEIERSVKKPSIESVERVAMGLDISLIELLNYNTNTMEVPSVNYSTNLFHDIHNCTEEEQLALQKVIKAAIEFRKL